MDWEREFSHRSMKLRDYQLDFVNACHKSWETHDAVLGVLPTGCGKTACFVEIAKYWEQDRVLVIAPQIELVSQAAKKLRQWTGIMPGIEQAHNRSNESEWGRSPFVVASKATLMSGSKERHRKDRYGVMQTIPAQKRYERLKDIGLVIVDEAHEGLTKPFKEIIDYYRNRGAKVLGVTATPKRHDNKALGVIYEECAYNMGIAEAIDAGWLVGPKTHCLQLQSLDLSTVGTKGANGDFKDAELAKAMENEKVVYEIAELTAAESRGLKTVVYCESIDQSRQVAGLLKDQHGYKAEYISSKCSKDKRQSVLESFTQDPDGVEVVVNCSILVVGWDYPGLQHLVMARPTKSHPRYCQIFGRGTRPLEGVVDFEGSTAELRKQAIARSEKPHFKLTDLRDNSLQHKLVTAVDVLAGDYSLDVQERARKLLEETDEARDLSEVMEEAKRAQEEFERQEREKLARRRATAKYHKQKVDPFDQSQQGPVAKSSTTDTRKIKFGKHKGTPMSDVPSDYLAWVVGASSLPWACKGPCKAELNRRKNHHAPAPKPKPQPTPAVQQTLANFEALLAEI